MSDPSPYPEGRIMPEADVLRNLIRGYEADGADVGNEPVRVLPDEPDGVRTVFGKHLCRLILGKPDGIHTHEQLMGTALFHIGIMYHLGLFASDARNGLKLPGTFRNYLECSFPEPADYGLSHGKPYALHSSSGKIFEYRLGTVKRNDGERGYVELPAEFGVIPPFALELELFRFIYPREYTRPGKTDVRFVDKIGRGPSAAADIPYPADGRPYLHSKIITHSVRIWQYCPSSETFIGSRK